MTRTGLSRLTPFLAGALIGVFALVAEVNLSAPRGGDRERSLISVSKADAWLSSAWNKARSAASWVGRKVSTAASYTWNGIKWTADKIKNAATAIYNKGKTFLIGQLKEAWKALKKFDCSGVVSALAPFANPLVYALSSLVPGGYGTTCYNNLYAGFLCGIPDAIVSLGKMIYGIGEATWNNKTTCLKVGAVLSPLFAYMGPLAPAQGLFMCGAFYYFKNAISKFASNIGKAYQCFKKLSQSELIKLMLGQAVGTVCNFLGSIAFDIVLAALTAGSGAVASVAKWITKVKDFLALLNPLEHLKKLGAPKISSLLKISNQSAERVFDAGANFYKDQLKGLAECGGTGKTTTSASTSSSTATATPAAATTTVSMAATPAMVSWNTLGFRTGPTTGHKLIRYLKKGYKVTLYGKAGNWYKLKYGSTYGYSSGSGLTITKSTTTPATTTKPSGRYYGKVVWNSVVLRKGPSKSYSVIRTLRKGERVYVYYLKGTYLRVRYGSRTYGYAYYQAIGR